MNSYILNLLNFTKKKYILKQNKIKTKKRIYKIF